MSNPNLWIWTTDWHVVSSDTDTGGLGEDYPQEAAAISEHIRGIQPAGVIDTGDTKDHYIEDQPSGVGDEQDNYISIVRSRLPWGRVNAGVNATYPILPGNHDEQHDFSTNPSSTDLSTFDARFWGTPYHWTCDWAAPKIRFIGFHMWIAHAPDPEAGLWYIDTAENTWLTNELAALPVGWKAITCTHAPVDNADFGNGLAGVGQGFPTGDTTRSILASNASKITCHLNGHRHAPGMPTAVLSGITHFNGACMAYEATPGDSRGGWTIIEYLPGSSQLRFHVRRGPAKQGTGSLYSPFAASLYTPVTIPV